MRMCSRGDSSDHVGRVDSRSLPSGPFEFVFQIIQIVVGKDADFCAAEPGGVHDAGVNQFIENDDVILAEQRADGSDGCGIAGRKTQRGFGAFEAGERFLQFVMRRQRAANQPRRAGAGAKFFHGLDGGFLEQRVVGEAEIIVRRKIKQRLSADLDVRALRRIHAAQFAKQTLAANGVQALSQFCIERSHAGNLRFTICDLRAKRRKPVNRKPEWADHFGGITQRPSIMLTSTGPSWANTVS